MITAWFALWLGLAGAHDLQPGAIALRETAPNTFQMRLSPAQDGSGIAVQLEPRWPDGCHATGRELRCDMGLAGEVVVPELARRRVRVVAHTTWLDGTVEQTVLHPGRDRFVLGAGGGLPIRGYVAAGVAHVLGGIDHLMFVAGLVLVCRRRRAVIAAITAFTVAHSLTLAASVLGWAVAPPLATELVIALSILLVAREGLRDEETWTTRFPWAVALGFGLVHGFGFAGALQELGLPDGARTVALLLFNLGVEIGQLSALGLFGLVWLAWRRAPQVVRPQGRLIAGYAIGSMAGIWVVERAVAWVLALS